MNKRDNRFWLTGGIFLSCFLVTHPALAQIASDGSLPTEVASPDQQNFTITGGSRVGNNLFHSFREFSVPTDGSAAFEHAAQIENIFSRVTGGQVSNIDGIIRAQGSASLFLLNPSGIVFGPNARLDLGGSLIATTAERINFAQGGFFSAADPQAPLLEVNVPIGLQFGATPGSIVSRASAPSGRPDGLRVQPRQTLALIGGDVLVEESLLIAPAGEVELGSVGSNSLVSLAPVERGWDVDYQGVEDFQLLQINNSIVFTTPFVSGIFLDGERNGEIRIQGRQVLLSDTQLEGANSGDSQGGAILLNASEIVETNASFFTTVSRGSGSAGEVRINAPQVRLISSSINTSANLGPGGDIFIHAPELAELDGDGLTSTLLTVSTFQGQGAGDVEIVTPRLILRDGGQITSSTRNSGDGGNIVIQAAEQVEISGTGNGFVVGEGVREVPSGIFSETQEVQFGAGNIVGASGNGGRVTINTGRLIVRDGGEISVAAEGEGAGRAGDLEINALDRVEIVGDGSSLQALSESDRLAGNLTINTDELVVREGAQINVSATGEGTAGNLMVNAGSIRLAKQGLLTAETRSGEGNIKLEVDRNIILRSNSSITTNATEAASGGNIVVATDLLVLLENSAVTATAVAGRGGNIAITAQSVFRSPDGIIDASSQLGIDGTVTIETPEVEPDTTATELPSNLRVPQLIAGCQASSTVARLTNIGRGGLSPAPSEPLSYSNIWEDIALPRHWSAVDAAPPAQLVEARGWIVNEHGNVVLVSELPPAASRGCWQSQGANGSS